MNSQITSPDKNHCLEGDMFIGQSLQMFSIASALKEIQSYVSSGLISHNSTNIIPYLFAINANESITSTDISIAHTRDTGAKNGKTQTMDRKDNCTAMIRRQKQRQNTKQRARQVCTYMYQRSSHAEALVVIA